VRVPWGVEQSAAGAVAPLLDVTPGAVASHLTAARLLGVPLPWDAPLGVHLSTVDGGNRPVRRGVVGHRLTLLPEDVVTSGTLRLTSPRRTWLDLAGLLSHEDLVVAGDHLVNEQRRRFGGARKPYCRLADLEAVLASYKGTRHLGKARDAVARVRVGADSAPETKLRLACEDAGLPEPELRYEVLDETGWAVAWPDLAFVRWKVAVNYDGRHHLQAQQRRNDLLRDEALAALGWITVTIDAEIARHVGFGGAAAKIEAALRRGGWAPGIEA